MRRVATVTKPARPGKSTHTLMTVQVLERKPLVDRKRSSDSLVTYRRLVTYQLPPTYNCSATVFPPVHLTGPPQLLGPTPTTINSITLTVDPTYYILSLRTADEDINHHRSTLGRRIRGGWEL